MKQLRLLSKSMQLLDIQADFSGKGAKLAEVKSEIKKAHEGEKSFDNRRDALRDRMRNLLDEKKKK